MQPTSPFRLLFALAGWVLMLFSQQAHGQNPAQLKFEDNGELIAKLLAKRPQDFANIVANADKYEIQIIYTKITRDNENKPTFKHYPYRVNPQTWFSPASLVKLPVAAMALEKVHITGVDKDDRMEFGAVQPCQSACKTDATSPTGYPSVAHYIKKIFAVSDNDAYNRLYEYLGQKYMNDRLWNMGYFNARILHRYWNCGTEDNRCTNPVSFFDSTGTLIHTQPATTNPEVLQFPFGHITKGRGALQSNGEVNWEPMDFTFTNFITMEDLHQILISIMMPKAVPADQRFRLKEEDYIFLRTCMSMLPDEFVTPHYDPEKYPDSYVKYLMFGDKKDSIPSNIRIFNKVGQAFGYLSDCAYIVDYDTKVEFFLSAVIYCNEDGVMNDNKDEFKTIGFPYLAKLGQLFYDYESSRNKKVKPKLRAYTPLDY